MNDPGRFAISDRPTEGEIVQIQAELDAFNRLATGTRYHFPGVKAPGLTFDLAVRGPSGSIVGGINVSSILGVMWLEVLWVHEAHRGRGIASWLVLEAERIAHERGCVGAGTWTFDWQGAGFYPRIGYELRGVYDGYPGGMTEHVLTKRLPGSRSVRSQVEERAEGNRHGGYALVPHPTRDAMRAAHRGLREHCAAHVGEGAEYAGDEVCLAQRNGAGILVGGLVASTPVRVLALEEIWIDERFRGLGHGRELVEAAERVAREAGCVAAQACVLSFQSPAFFHALGYTCFGTVDVYPGEYVEDLLIKRWSSDAHRADGENVAC